MKRLEVLGLNEKKVENRKFNIELQSQVLV